MPGFKPLKIAMIGIGFVGRSHSLDFDGFTLKKRHEDKPLELSFFGRLLFANDPIPKDLGGHPTAKQSLMQLVLKQLEANFDKMAHLLFRDYVFRSLYRASVENYAENINSLTCDTRDLRPVRSWRPHTTKHGTDEDAEGVEVNVLAAMGVLCHRLPSVQRSPQWDALISRSCQRSSVRWSISGA